MLMTMTTVNSSLTIFNFILLVPACPDTQGNDRYEWTHHCGIGDGWI